MIGDALAEDEPAAAPVMTIQHRLKVATALNFTNGDVDAILQKMTQMAREKAYAWSSACNIEFVRDGDVIINSQLPTDGDDKDEETTLSQIAPQANVLIVNSIHNCGGVEAAGCTPENHEPEIVINDDSTRGVVVWFHERGHSMNLQHVGQDKSPDSVPDNIYNDVMFWNPSSTSQGITAQQCDAYRKTKFKSTVAVPNVALAAMAAPIAPSAPPDHYGLTDSAFKLLDSAGESSPPNSEIAKLSTDDISQ